MPDIAYLLRSVQVDDPEGGQVFTWPTTGPALPCRKLLLLRLPQEQDQGGAIRSQQLYTFKFHWDADIHEQDRFLHEDGAIYQVTSADVATFKTETVVHAFKAA